MIRSDFVKWTGIFCLLIGGLASAVDALQTAISPGFSKDFQYFAAHLFLHGYNAIEAFVPYRTNLQFWFFTQAPNYPPTSIVLLWPIAAFDWPTAQWLWALTNACLTATCLILLRRLFFRNAPTALFALLCALWLLSIPWRVGVSNGQHALFSLTFFLAAFFAIERNKCLPAALLIATSWLKFTITMPLCAAFLLRKNALQLFALAAVPHVILLCALSFYIGTHPLQLLFAPLNAHTVGNGVADIYTAFNLLGWSPSTSYVLGFAILCFTVWVSRSDPCPRSILARLTWVSLFITLHLIYDFAILLIPLAFALTNLNAARPRAAIYAGATLWFWFAEPILLRTVPTFVTDNKLFFVLNFAILASVCVFDCLHAAAKRSNAARPLAHQAQ